ncbi:TetR/AcrR family transcriptional regulator [Chryseobacterium sp. RRHN12]|uniref:TetR/AcrR family transcriptional regulator n=1 Tax=Chryseobacterium sp. RRHN12 TaxID=3437884 RepID=UPI003D9B71C6
MTTRQKIMQSAKTLIFGEGKFNLLLSEISDNAGISQSTLHYYFRTREKLFIVVENEMIAEFMEEGKSWITSGLSIREKVELYISTSYKRLSLYPFADLYLLSRINRKSDTYTDEFHNDIMQFSSEIQRAINTKIITRYDNPVHFIINMISLTAHPFILLELLQKTHVIEQSEKHNILEHQKRIIIENLFF